MCIYLEYLAQGSVSVLSSSNFIIFQMQIFMTVNIIDICKKNCENFEFMKLKVYSGNVCNILYKNVNWAVSDCFSLYPKAFMLKRIFYLN